MEAFVENESVKSSSWEIQGLADEEEHLIDEDCFYLPYGRGAYAGMDMEEAGIPSVESLVWK